MFLSITGIVPDDTGRKAVAITSLAFGLAGHCLNVVKNKMD